MRDEFATFGGVLSEVSEVVRPSRRRLPSVAAAETLRNDKGPWSADLTPYMIEPLNDLAGRRYQGIVFVGPARTGKSFTLILGGIAYIVTAAPGDMLVVQMSKESARDFSRNDLDRAIRYSSALADAMTGKGRDDNTFDKFFRSGVSLKLGWPAVSQLSSKTLQYVFLTDYDRPENVNNVDGEGPMWDLAAKRTQTFMSRGKCLAESSPGFDVKDPEWVRSTPHQAPPADGILGLYNRGTRAMWYWQCLHCGHGLLAEPGPSIFGLPKFEELVQIVPKSDLVALADEYARVICSQCGSEHRMEDRPALQRTGAWLHEGQTFDEHGDIAGERRRSQISSYWLGGAAAAYQRWDSMLLKYFQAVQSWATTADEAPLRAVTNTDFGAPYLSVVARGKRKVADLLLRREDYPRGVVPEGVYFLTAQVDVQGTSFVVSVMGWGRRLESWIIDRFSIVQSPGRMDGARPAQIDPATYIEDWDAVREQVIDKTYPLAENDELRMPVALILCDSGGREGVTVRAYDYWRKCREEDLGRRFQLLKGSARVDAPRAVQTWPDARQRQDRRSGARGDVPVWMLNTNAWKDAVDADLKRPEPGPGFTHLPDWMPENAYLEYVAEERTDKGWKNPQNKRNESFDLHGYGRAGAYILGAEQLDWDNPPEWAQRPSDGAPTQPVMQAARVKIKRRSYLR